MSNLRMKMDNNELDIIQKAFFFSKERHYGQKDDCGKDYFSNHIEIVFLCLCRICPEDKELLVASLLHDTIEDTDTTYEEIKSLFGVGVADLVHEVTHEGQKDQKGFYFPRLKTQRGIMLKFADRLSNLSRMDSWDKKRKDQYLRKSKFWKSE